MYRKKGPVAEHALRENLIPHLVRGIIEDGGFIQAPKFSVHEDRKTSSFRAITC